MADDTPEQNALPSPDGPCLEGPRVLLSRTGVAMGCFVVFSAVLYFGTRLIQGKPLSLPAPRYFPSAKDKPLAGGPIPTAATRHLEPPVVLRTTVQPLEPPPPAEGADRPGAEPLEGFFKALRRTEAREAGAITRICHWGDSQIVADNITSSLRRRFQQKYGDSGHGFVSVGRPSSYLHRYLWHWDKGWSFVGVAQAGFPDRMYGLGGMASFAKDDRAMARFATRDSYPVGRRVSRFEVGFLVHAEGGRFKVLVDEKDVATVDTRLGRHDPALLLADAPAQASGSGAGPGSGPGPGAGAGPGAGTGQGSGAGQGAGTGPGAGAGPGAGTGQGSGAGPGSGPGPAKPVLRADGVFLHRMPDAGHEITIRALGFGIVRLHGAVLERDEPGVVYDSLGLKGAQLHDLARLQADHFARQLRWRAPALLVFGFGTNESYQNITMSDYKPKWRVVLDRARKAAPEASCLVLGPVDRVYQHRHVHPRTVPLTNALREVALAAGCAFWDTYEAMGGGNAALTYRRAGLLYGDLAHLNPDGGERLGGLIFTALTERYEHWKKARKAAITP